MSWWTAAYTYATVPLDLYLNIVPYLTASIPLPSEEAPASGPWYFRGIEAATKVYAADIIDKAKYQIRRDKQEKLGRLKHELQNYIDNASFGLPETRRRNMILLRWDIRKFERELQNA